MMKFLLRETFLIEVAAGSYMVELCSFCDVWKDFKREAVGSFSKDVEYYYTFEFGLTVIF